MVDQGDHMMARGILPLGLVDPRATPTVDQGDHMMAGGILPLGLVDPRRPSGSAKETT